MRIHANNYGHCRVCAAGSAQVGHQGQPPEAAAAAAVAATFVYMQTTMANAVFVLQAVRKLDIEANQQKQQQQ